MVQPIFTWYPVSVSFGLLGAQRGALRSDIESDHSPVRPVRGFILFVFNFYVHMARKGSEEEMSIIQC